MSVCPSCNSRLSCGCQIRTASNGARVCSFCVAGYEKKLADKAATVVPKQPDKPSQNISVQTTPTNIKVMYNPPQ